MPKGRKNTYVDCDACGCREPEQHLARHKESLKCKATQIHNRYEALDWRALDATKAKIAIDAGVPHEEVLAGLHLEEHVIGREGSGTHRRLKTEMREALHPITFVPRGAMRVLVALQGLKLGADLRKRAVGALWDQSEDLVAQIETIRRLDGSLTSYVWRLVIEAEERKRRGKTDELAQDEEHGKATAGTAAD